MAEWTPQGLCGFGNMLTPAMQQSFGESISTMIINCDMGGAYAFFGEVEEELGFVERWHLFHYNDLESSTVCKPLFHPDGSKLFAVSGHSRLKVATDLYKPPRDWSWKPLGSIDTGKGRPEDYFPNRIFGEIAYDPSTGLMLLSTTGDDLFNGYGFIDQQSNCQGIEVTKAESKLWRSIDHGATWKQATIAELTPNHNLGFILGIHIDRRKVDSTSDNRTCYAAAQTGMLVSTNGGQNWELGFEGQLPVSMCHPIRSFAAGSQPPREVAPDDSTEEEASTGKLRLYLSFENTEKIEGVGLIRKMNDEDWEVCPTKGISQEIGEEPELCKLIQFHHIITSNHNPDVLYAFHAGTDYLEPNHVGAYALEKNGTEWRETVFSDPRMPHFNMQPDWEMCRTFEGAFEPGNGIAVCPDVPHRLLVVGTRVHFKNGPYASWRNLDSDYPKRKDKHPPLGWRCNGLGVTAAWDYFIDPHDSVFPDAPRRHYIAYTDIGFARSLDQGETWRWGGSRNITWQNTVYDILIDPESPSRMWAAFSSVHDIPNGNVILFYQGIVEEKHKEGFVGFSDDHGQTWHFPTKNLPNHPVTCLTQSEEGDLLAGVWEKGVYRLPSSSLNQKPEEMKWEPVNEGLGTDINRRVWRLHKHVDGTLFALITANTKKVGDDADFESINDGVGLYKLAKNAERWERLGTEGIEGTDDNLLRWPRDFAVDPEDSKRVLIANSEPIKELPKDKNEHPSTQAGIFSLNSETKMWDRLEGEAARKHYRYYGVYLHPTEKDWLYITLNDNQGYPPVPGLWLSKDRGKTFSSFLDFPFKNVHKVVVDPHRPPEEALIVMTNGAGVFRGPVSPDP